RPQRRRRMRAAAQAFGANPQSAAAASSPAPSGALKRTVRGRGRLGRGDACAPTISAPAQDVAIKCRSALERPPWAPAHASKLAAIAYDTRTLKLATDSSRYS